MTLDRNSIEDNLKEYVAGVGDVLGIGPVERYATFDYCFNYFQHFREQNQTIRLAQEAHMQISCLQLGYYLASWGMYRGSSFLLNKNARVFEQLIRAISKADQKLWEIDVDSYSSDNIRVLLDFKNEIENALPHKNGPTPTLVTKIMLGVFGNIPAFDDQFRKGFKKHTVSKRSLELVAHFIKSIKTLLKDIVGQPLILTPENRRHAGTLVRK